MQGILLIIISIYFFSHPVAVLAALSIWVGLLTLGTGVTGIAGYFGMEKDERESNQLWWSIATLLFGLLMVMKLGITMKTITLLFGIWMLLTGYWLSTEGWALRKEGSLGWIMLVAGVLSVVAGLASFFNIYSGAMYISTLIGLQALLAGIGLLVLALVKRRLGNKMKAKINKWQKQRQG